VGRVGLEVQSHGRFKTCAEGHGLRLHRIHVLSAGSTGSFQSTLVFDCTCGLRWLLRVSHGDVVAVDRSVLEELRRGREGQVTAPPGFAGAPARRKPGPGGKGLGQAARQQRARNPRRVRH
jgi:hypothetical protein